MLQAQLSNFRLSSRQHHHHSRSPGFHRSMPTYGSTLSCDNPFLRPASDPPQQLRHHPSLFRLAFNTSKAELHKYVSTEVHKLRYYSIPCYLRLNPDDRRRHSLMQVRLSRRLDPFTFFLLRTPIIKPSCYLHHEPHTPSVWTRFRSFFQSTHSPTYDSTSTSLKQQTILRLAKMG